MKEINIREFTRNIYQHIKDKEEIVVTKNNKFLLKVSFNEELSRHSTELSRQIEPKISLNEELSRHSEELSRHIPVSKIDSIGKEYRINHYGCGCVKDNGKVFCTKHNRT